MTLATQRRTRSEHIGDILTSLEHLWKMQPDKTFVEVLRQVSPTFAESLPGGLLDDEFERDLRAKLRSLFMNSDRT